MARRFAFDDVFPGPAPDEGDTEYAEEAIWRLNAAVTNAESRDSGFRKADQLLANQRSATVAAVRSKLLDAAVMRDNTLLRDACLGTADTLKAYWSDRDRIHHNVASLRREADTPLWLLNRAIRTLNDYGCDFDPRSWDEPIWIHAYTVATHAHPENQGVLEAARQNLTSTQETLTRLRQRWALLRDDRERVDRAAVAKLDSTPNPSTPAIGGGGASLGTIASSSLQTASAIVTALGNWTGTLTTTLANLSEEGDTVSVSALWNSLDTSAKSALIGTHPLQIGNLDGVPIRDRIRANQVTARIAANRPGISDVERSYWQDVVSGAIPLVVCDPASERIVEMVGDFDENTTTVITYVPGTNASVDSFYDGSVQHVANYVVNRDKSGSTVAFVYKDGPWVTWAGENANWDEDALTELGAKLSSFQNSVIGIESELAGASQNVFGHSAGLTVVSASETAGTHYDHVFSLAGSYLVDGWKPEADTKYDHYQYGRDAINYLDAVKTTPHESSIFIEHEFTPDTVTIGAVTFQNELNNHGRIAEGPPDNSEALKQMYEDLKLGK